MEADVIQGLLGAIPGGGIAAVAIWFAIRKDNQCTAQMERMTELVKQSVASSIEVRQSLDAIRDAIRAGTRS